MSTCISCLVPASDGDHVDEVIQQWARERPDLELGPMATFGRLVRVFMHSSRSIESVFAKYDLNIGEFDVLAALRRAGDPYVMMPSELARMLMLTPAGMTNRLDRLEANGFIERRPDPEDRRSSPVALTDGGRRVVDAAVAEHVANEARLLEPLTATDRAALDKALRKLLAQFE